jgi:carbonic anhydrase
MRAPSAFPVGGSDWICDMPSLDDLAPANARYAATFDGSRPKYPQLHLAVLTCMDTRLDPLPALGLQVGDVHVLRNAGGIPTDDMLRSLAISQRALGTREIAVIQHTGCGMQGFDDDAFRAELEADSGQAPPWRVPGFDDVVVEVRQSVQAVRACGWLPYREDVRGFVFDIASGVLDAVE